MRAIVPLLPRDKREAVLWLKGPGRHRIEHLLRSLADWEPISNILLPVSDSSGPWATQDWESLAPNKARIVPISAPRQAGGNRCGLDDLAHLARTMPQQVLPAGEAVLALDFRNSGLDVALLAKALESWSAAPQLPLLSTLEVTDHPCQFKRSFRVLEIGSMRVSLRSDKPQGEDDLPWAKPDAKGNYTIVAGPKDKACLLQFPQAGEREGATVVLQPFGTYDGIGFPAQEFKLSSDASSSVRMDLDPRRTEGILYALLQRVESGESEIVCPARPGGGLWRHNRRGEPVRGDDGRKILGRQDFPVLFELEGSLTIARPNQWEGLRELCGQGLAKGFVLEQGQIVTDSESALTLARARLARPAGGVD